MIPVLTNKTDLSNSNFASGFVVLINKEQNWTSFDVVKKLRNVVHTRKAGHGGTLDPFATGLLLIGMGKGTKALTELSALKKTYRAKIQFGITTDSCDRTGNVLAEKSTDRLTIEEIRQSVEEMTGDIEQVPPMYSAKKVNGVRLYKLARKNIEIDRKAQKVTIFSAQIEEWNNPVLDLTLTVSKGTYIRAYANDLGKMLKVGANLKELERTAVDKYKLGESFTVSEFIKFYKEADADSARSGAN